MNKKIKEIIEALEFMGKVGDVSKIAVDNLKIGLEELDEQLSIQGDVVPKGTLCDDWIHQERIKANDDKYCPLCGKKLQA
jgi:Zn finger protein HypA/HybF involved in hydrogenase expression